MSARFQFLIWNLFAIGICGTILFNLYTWTMSALESATDPSPWRGGFRLVFTGVVAVLLFGTQILMNRYFRA
jgi:hypothetical protein